MNHSEHPLPDTARLMARARLWLADMTGLDRVGDPVVLKAEIERRLKAEMDPAIEASNTLVDRTGLPLERYRVF